MDQLKSQGFLSGGELGLDLPNSSEAIESASKIVELAENIGKVLDKIYALKKEGQGISIKVPEGICQYDAIVKVRGSGIVSKNIAFQLPEVDNVTGVCMPSLKPLHDSIRKTAEGFCLFLEGVPDGTDYILLQFQYKTPGADFMSNLVESSVSAEPEEHNDRDEYWMHAGLKFPQILVKAYSHLRLENIELNVDVAVENELKTAVPAFVIKSLRSIRKLLGHTDRNLSHQAMINYLRSKRQIGMDIYSLMAQINNVFLPTRFKSFVEVTSPFKYHDSKQGSDFYDYPGQILPKVMAVTSRTDLSLQNPARDGKVIYKKTDLSKELEKIFK